MSKYLHVYGTKGGVGKTTVAVNLAYQLASTGRTVGLLDLDITGPNVPQLVADLPGEVPRMEDFRVRPGRRGDVFVSSVGYFVDPVDTPFLAGRYLSGAVVQLTAHPMWSDCDVVVVDLPPGFGELHRQVFHDLSGTVVLVSTSHVLASRDTERGIHLLRELDVPVVGLVENLSTVHCEHCGQESRLLDSRAMPWAAHVKRLGSLPFVRGPAGDSSVPIVVRDDPADAAFRTVMQAVAHQVCGGGLS